MTTAEKGRLIAAIIQRLRSVSRIQRKAFNEADTFFSLAFMTDDQLKSIAKLVIL